MNQTIVEYPSPIGMVEIIGSEEYIYSILFLAKEEQEYKVNSNTPEIVKQCYDQMDEYFQGKRKTFTFPIKMEGTLFQTKVWNALTTIPYGETGSYKDIANHIENAKAIRAVGSANGKNKLSIVLPCHRIIGANGTLTGYAGGLWRKEWLLLHEQKFKNHRMK
ncbi:methylated-DNA--[protein]-cysteine S-methyltransferase [Bacillus sp. B1-b2]|uniref:methylated-DNA--[protein]-cysteine S-methyltransferase n=1 Tax=Bacillus sp. B1-b2 TaxID=2653201 RepID=UPI0012617F0B|nr:methylated-DNA--[protein]-cysteine S-methyltransferase [Bacillus sp. B1-b2]KAB7666327.1 methylated-DNA--[protein]-cysteine S-methyltransferase [Bacillus sp. B1-b2]